MHETATTAAVTLSVKSGAIGMVSAYLFADAHLATILIVGTIGALASFFRELAHLQIKSTLPKILSEFFFTIPLGVALAVLVSEIVDKYYPMQFGGVAISLIASLHSRSIINFIAPLFADIAKAARNSVVNKLDKKDKHDDNDKSL